MLCGRISCASAVPEEHSSWPKSDATLLFSNYGDLWVSGQNCPRHNLLVWVHIYSALVCGAFAQLFNIRLHVAVY